MKNAKSFLPGIILAVTGVAMMAFGVYKGEATEVFLKAIRICLECIGIG